MATRVFGSIPQRSSRSALALLALVALAAVLLASVQGALLATSATDATAPARPATKVRQLSCEPLADVPGKSVTTALVVFPPRAYTPAHRHPGSVTAYVVSGSIRSQMDAMPPTTYPAGSTWFEPAGALHLFAENPSPSETAELLAVFVTSQDCGPLVIPEPHAASHNPPSRSDPSARTPDRAGPVSLRRLS